MKCYAESLILLLMLSASYPSAGQVKFIILSGKITDSQTQRPIPFVNIQLKSGSIGTATNAEGEFIFKIPESLSGDTLLISCIGYKTAEKSLRSVGLNISIALEPATVVLAEVTVNAPTGLDILKKALAKIPENYDTSDFHMMAFYREDIGLGDFQLTYNEAVLDIFKTFKTDPKNPTDEIKVIKGRKKKIDLSSDFRLYLWIRNFSNGARGNLGTDFIKYRIGKFSPLDPKNFRYYNYEYGEATKSGDRNLIVIEVLPKKNSRKAIFKLKLFIDEESLAIVKCEWDLTKSGVDLVERKDKNVAYAIMQVAVSASIEYQKFYGTVYYKEYNGKWYLSSSMRRLESLINSKKRKMIDRLWYGELNLQITDIDTLNKRHITEGNIGDSEASIESLMGNDYDEAFWENFNIVKPVIPDSLKSKILERPKPDSIKAVKSVASNRQNGFTRGDTLRGKLTPLRTCYDVTFYHLDVAINMDQRSVKGNNLIRFKVEQPFQKMQVDLYENMRIDKILYKDQQLAYSREYNAVFINFPEELKQGTQSEIKIYYEGVPKTPDWSIPMNGGVLWDKDSLGNQWVQMVCQGSGASLWWPNKDHQSDEPDSMKIWITVPSKFTEISNGRLIHKTPRSNNQTRYEWYVSYPINNYNVTFNIGKYVHYSDRYISDDTLTIDYYVMPYNLDRAKKMFMQTKPMLETFEKNFGKYPFKRDGFTLIESIYPMEHQSGVCIGKINQENSGDTNPLMWHESAHEWWGNAITCKDVADMWIHEAFATYAEIQVIEHRFGKEAGYTAILDQVDAVGNKEPVIGVYDVNHIYYDIGDMYSKGSLMLHTFRNVLNNDTLWVNLLHDIQKHFRYQTITTDQLIAYINLQTQTNYTYLFDQYLKYTALPKLETNFEENEDSLVLKYRWKADVENFRMPVKVTTAVDKFDFIYPTHEWKTITLKHMTADQFEVDEGFFIEVVEN